MSVQQKPKIALITIRNTYKFGGVAALTKIAYRFCQQYFNPTVFSLSFDPALSAHVRPLKFSSGIKTSIYDGMPWVEIGARWSFWEPGHYRFTRNQWKKVLADYDYVFVVSATPIAGHPVAQLNKRFLIWITTAYDHDRTERVKKLPWLRYFIDLCAHRFMINIEKKVLHHASHILALSTYAQHQFDKILEPEKRDITPCGYPISLTPQQNLPTSSIIAVGRFNDPRKNIEMLIRAFDKIYRAMPATILYVISQQPSAEIITTFHHYACWGNIIFTGPLDAQQLMKYYQQASVMLITSHQEGFGIAGLEALAHGVPVVSTDCGGPRDFVINDHNGYLVNVNDDDMMAQRALNILSSPTLHQRLQKNGYELVKNNFSEEAIFSKFKEALITVYPTLHHHFNTAHQQPFKAPDSSTFLQP